MIVTQGYGNGALVTQGYGKDGILVAAVERIILYLDSFITKVIGHSKLQSLLTKNVNASSLVNKEVSLKSNIAEMD
jgi:hypothetical protein